MKNPGVRVADFLMGGTESYRTEDGRKIYLFYTFNGDAQKNQYGIDIESNDAVRRSADMVRHAEAGRRPHLHAAQKDRHRHCPARARAYDQKRGRVMKRGRTYRYIPQRTIKTYDAGDLARQPRPLPAHGRRPAALRSVRVERLRGIGAACRCRLGAAEELFDKAVDGVQLEIAKHALGIGRKRYELVA